MTELIFGINISGFIASLVQRISTV